MNVLSAAALERPLLFSKFLFLPIGQGGASSWHVLSRWVWRYYSLRTIWAWEREMAVMILEARVADAAPKNETRA